MLKHDVNLIATISTRIFDVRFPIITMWYPMVMATVGGCQEVVWAGALGGCVAIAP